MTANATPLCENCDAPATCYGAYEGAEFNTFACDDCCAHGCEDGYCMPVDGDHYRAMLDAIADELADACRAAPEDWIPVRGHVFLSRDIADVWRWEEDGGFIP